MTLSAAPAGTKIRAYGNVFSRHRRIGASIAVDDLYEGAFELAGDDA